MLPMRCLAVTIVVLFALYACQGPLRDNEVGLPGHLEGELTITGAYALTPLIQACADSFSQMYPHVDITVTPLGSELALRHLANGKCDLAMVSRPISGSWEEELFALPVARTGVAFVFNKLNPYRDNILEHGLTVQDMQKVYYGEKDPSWDRFLGRNQKHPHQASTRADRCGTLEVLADFLYLDPSEMKGRPVEGEYRMIESVLKDSLALGYCNMSEAFDLHTGDRLEGLEFLPLDLNVNGSIEPREAICTNLSDFQNSICNNTYPFKLSRDLSLVSLKAPQGELETAFFQFILTDGQALVKQLGYSALSPSIINYNLYRMRKNKGTLSGL